MYKRQGEDTVRTVAMDSIPASVVKALSTEQYFEDQVILSLLKRINRCV